jgi:hypothetical protein
LTKKTPRSCGCEIRNTWKTWHPSSWNRFPSHYMSGFKVLCLFFLGKMFLITHVG